MNEFTKEELERLVIRSFVWVGHPENQNDYELELIKKIQSMIKNYCEHKWAFYISPHGNTVRCNLCNKRIPE